MNDHRWVSILLLIIDVTLYTLSRIASTLIAGDSRISMGVI
jgi:hypothetical protein